jgi:hypothetical protein
MKKTLLIALLLIPFIGFSQTTKPIDGFLGIKFGSSKAIVLAAMKAKGAILDKENTDATNLVFSDVKLGARTADGFIVKFVNDKAFEADYIFKPEAEGKLLGEYNDLVADIARVYGKGEATNKYTSPYKEGEGDDDTLVGLSAGKIDISTLWVDANQNSVGITISTDMTVDLTYQNDKLTDEAIKKQQAKDKSDF